MILSFHPCITGNKNLICAGRQPDADDNAAIKSADAVILPQGCSPLLYGMARRYCRHVFPDYDARFKYPGKIGQIQLFQSTNTPHPRSLVYDTVDEFFHRHGEALHIPGNRYPFVFKFDWGGEGETVYLVKSKEAFKRALARAEKFERTGQTGFLIQEYLPSQTRVLRTVVVYRKLISYWRVRNDTRSFGTNLATGATVDKHTDPDFQKLAKEVTIRFCKKTGINLAGFDFLVGGNAEPFMLEINYFFGRKGLGGSEKWYDLLELEIGKWLKNLGLS